MARWTAAPWAAKHSRGPGRQADGRPVGPARSAPPRRPKARRSSRRPPTLSARGRRGTRASISRSRPAAAAASAGATRSDLYLRRSSASGSPRTAYPIGATASASSPPGLAQRQVTLITPGKPSPSRPQASSADHSSMLGAAPTNPPQLSASGRGPVMVDVWAHQAVPKRSTIMLVAGYCRQMRRFISHSMYMYGSVPSGISGDALRDWLVLRSVRSGIVDRGQALALGFSRRQISHRLDSGAWQRMYPGVYATFTGPMPREARMWAAVRAPGMGRW